jgi:hypothetical protein
MECAGEESQRKKKTKKSIYIIIVDFEMFFCVFRHMDSNAPYLPTGLLLGFFRSSPSLFLPSSV